MPDLIPLSLAAVHLLTVVCLYFRSALPPFVKSTKPKESLAQFMTFKE